MVGYSKFSIRYYLPKDAKSIIKVHYDSVHKIASKDYETEILNDWSPKVTTERIKKFLENQLKGKEYTVVAEIKGKIVGFGVIVPKEKEIRAVYVSPKTKRFGIGTALLKRLEKFAKRKGINKLHLSSSITAEKFYLKNGYKVVSYGKFTLKTGRKMKCVNMKKIL